MTQQISIQKARELLGETGLNLTDKEIEKLKSQLYGLISQILDNNINSIQPCKKQ